MLGCAIILRFGKLAANTYWISHPQKQDLPEVRSRNVSASVEIRCNSWHLFFPGFGLWLSVAEEDHHFSDTASYRHNTRQTASLFIKHKVNKQ